MQYCIHFENSPTFSRCLSCVFAWCYSSKIDHCSFTKLQLHYHFPPSHPPQVGSSAEIRVLILNRSLLKRYNLVWSRDGVTLSPSNRYTFSNDHVVPGETGAVIASLTIGGVTTSDSGLYQVYFSGLWIFIFFFVKILRG